MNSTYRSVWLALLALGLSLAAASGSRPVAAAPDSSTAAAVAAAPGAKDTAPTKKDLVQPEALAKDLALPEWRRPVLLHVGFSVLYKSGHIPGSKYVGSGSTARGRTELKKALKGIPKDKPVVLYCGCCPWEHCPNVNPAFRVARGLGYDNVKILYIVQDLQRDWVDKGYPALVQ